jgi:predicted esterase
MAHDNHGRPIIFIGHSQGAAMLIRLLQNKIDRAQSCASRWCPP